MNANLPPLGQLTKREKDILLLLVQGKSNQDIADELVLSLNTVKWYNRQIYSKLGVENREQTAELAQMLGLVESKTEITHSPALIRAVTTPVLGRERELNDLDKLFLDKNIQLITLVGPGGIGKTTLAMEVAHRISDYYDDGVAFISFASLSSAETVVPAIAQALKVELQERDSRNLADQLISYLHSKRLLLILDNFEHLLNAVSIVSKIIQAAPQIQLLVTSRERLKLQTEQVYPLQGLPLTRWESVDEAERDPAVQLFLHHARRVQPKFVLRSDHLQPFQSLFQRVGGMPLAIVLAAGWVEVLSPSEILSELSHNLDLLESTDHDVPTRHQSIKAVFEGTWARLSDEERNHYAALSNFRNGFTLEAAHEVASASPRDLLRLVERSLLVRNENDRFEQHELLRQFAAGELARSHLEEAASRQRHSAYYGRFLAQQEANLKNTKAVETEAKISLELENIRIAWQWACANSDESCLRQMAPVLGLYFFRRWRWREGADMLHQGAVAPKKISAPTAGILLAWQAYLLCLTFEYELIEEGTRLALKALNFLAETEEQEPIVRTSHAIALIALGISQFNEPNKSLASLNESLDIFSRLEMRWEMAAVYTQLRITYEEMGDTQKGTEQLLHAQKIYEIIGDYPLNNRIKLELGLNWTYAWKLDEAETVVREALAWFLKKGPASLLAYAWIRLGQVLINAGRYQEAYSALEISRPKPESLRYFHRELMMGVVNLHLGKYEAVHEASISLLPPSYEDEHQFNGINHRTIGFASLALGWFGSAQVNLLKSVNNFDVIGYKFESDISKSGLAYLAIQQGKYSKARKHIVRILKSKSNHQSLLIYLHILPTTALLLLETGDTEGAIELNALASTYEFIANSRWFYNVAGQKIEEIAAQLPAETVAAVQERGKGLDLWETVDVLLRRFSGNGD